jgi:uncharacterized membrane protein
LGIGILISFIHHVATSLQATHIIAAAATDTLEGIDVIFPEKLGENESDEEPEPDFQSMLHGRTWYPIPAASNGYIQSVETDRLLEYAVKHNSIVCMERGVGDFAIVGAPLIWTIRRVRPGEEEVSAVNKIFAIDRHRTIEQDAPFGVRQLVDIALKALSPGVNDTTTAVTCVDYLTAIMAKLACRRFPSRFRYHQNELRVIAISPMFDELWALAFDQIRRNSEDNIAVLWRQLRAFQVIGRLTDSPSRREALRRQLAHYEEYVHRIEPDSDRTRLQIAYSRASMVLAGDRAVQKPAPSAIGDAA